NALDHRIPVVKRHLVKNHVAQDAGIVDHAVDAPEDINGGLHDALRAVEIGDAVGAGHGLTAGLPDFGDHFAGRRGIGALALQRGTDVIDHDLRAFFRHQQRDVPADAATGAGHHHDFSRNDAFTHDLSPVAI